MEIEQNNINDNNNNGINNFEINIDIPKENIPENNNENQMLENEWKNKFIIENDEYYENILEKEEEKDKKKKIVLITKYSNLEQNLFLDEFILDYKCISCGLIPSYEKAHETLCCGCLICEECLNKLKEEKKGCIICNTNELQTRDIKKENKIFYKSYKSLLIKCPYKCEWQGMWVDLDTHLIDCKLGYRECKYKLIGCDFADENLKVKEHEESNNKFHLDLALKFIKDKKIEKKTIKFELGETLMTTCHPHIMIYMTSLSWCCDGREHECYSESHIFSASEPRFRCRDCNFDLCDKCIVHYLA